ncbi:MAG: hypothetical protein JST00_06545 [Deltaproteobacteria bacterium]|nr:hypothetical protein [Deltaproteobacteria bacterium]
MSINRDSHLCREPHARGRAARTVVVALCVGTLVVAAGCARDNGTANASATTPAKERVNPFGRKVQPSERWSFSDPQAVKDLQGTTFGEQEIEEFWLRKGWKLTKREEAYFAMVDTLTRDGYVTKVSRWSKCPYNPIYQALVPVDVLGVHVRSGQEFNMDMCDPDAEVKLGTPRFVRKKGYEEDHAEGHSSDTARN